MQTPPRLSLSRDTLLLGILGLLGLALTYFLYPKIEPAFQADIALDRSDILERSTAFLVEQDLDPADYTDRTAAFLFSNRLLAFLAHHEGAPAAETVAFLEHEPTAYWTVMLRSGAEDWYRLHLTPDGRIYRAARTLPNHVPGEQLTQDAARMLVQDYLSQRKRVNWERYELVDAQQIQHEARTDYTFTWQQMQPGLGGARLRLSGVVQGDAVAGWTFSAQLPATFIDQYSHATLPRQAFSITRSVLINLLWIFALLGFALRFRASEVSPRNGFIVAILAFVFYVAANANVISYLREMIFSQTSGAPGVSTYIFIAMGAVFVPVAIFFTWAAGESYAREWWPEKLVEIDGLFARRFFFPALGAGMMRGVVLGVAQVGLWCLVMWIAVRFFSATPRTLELHDQIFSAYVPLGYPSVLGGYAALVSIAFTYLYTLAGLKQLTKRTWTAAAGAVLMNVLIIDTGTVEPFYLTLLGLVGISVLALFFFFRYSLFTVAIGSVVSTAFAIANMYAAQSASFLHLAGTVGCLVPLALFGYGLLAYRFGKALDERRVRPSYHRYITERERLKMELDIARRAQLRMLPREIPSIQGLDIAAFSEPAKEVGGDYFDFFPLGESQLGVAVGDVSGKGMPAALYMTLLKGFLQSRSESATSPKEILSHVNRTFFQAAERNIFVTLFYGVITLQPGNLRFARAGHNPVLLYRAADQTTLLLRPPGIGIGLEHGPVFDRIIQEENVALQPGDTLVVYTDGLTEARNAAHEEFGEARLLELIKLIHLGTAEEILQQIRAVYYEFIGKQDAHDDLTCLVVKVV